MGLSLGYTGSSACDSKPKPSPSPILSPSLGPSPRAFESCQNFDEFMAVFPDEDRESYPEMFKLPEGCYEVSLSVVENKVARPSAGWLAGGLFR